MKPASEINRRALVAQWGGIALAASATKLDAAATARHRFNIYSSAVGRKFYPNGMVMPFAGNTIICHLPQQGAGSDCFHALLDIYRSVPAHSFAPYVTLTPPSSYHMTVFAGADDRDRKHGAWPKDLPLDTPIADCNRIVAERLKSRHYDIPLPLRMKIDTAPSAPTDPLTIRLRPYNDAENAKLRTLRDELSATMQIRETDHASYRFHITMAYLIRCMPKTVSDDYRQQCADWHGRLAQLCPVIELGAPEYCVFKDMFAFERQFYLS